VSSTDFTYHLVVQPQNLQPVAERLLAKATGPSPWFCSRWARAGDLDWRKDRSGALHGHTPDGRTLFELPFSTYLFGAARGEISVMTNDECVVKVSTYRFDSSTPALAETAAASVPGQDSGVRSSAQSVEVTMVPVSSVPGVLDAPVRDMPSLPDEIAFPAVLPRPAGREALRGLNPAEPRIGPPRPASALCVWRPREGRVRVVPLPWFNEDTMDLGYQWIIRILADFRARSAHVR